MNKRKIDKVAFAKTKNFCPVKDPLKMMKRHSIDWEKIFANILFEKGLVSQIC